MLQSLTPFQVHVQVPVGWRELPATICSKIPDVGWNIVCIALDDSDPGAPIGLEAGWQADRPVELFLVPVSEDDAPLVAQPLARLAVLDPPTLST